MDNSNKQLTPADFPKASTASKLYLNGVEKGSKLHELINALNRIATYGTHQTPKGSIMYFEGVCEHDDGALCEHRLQWIVNFIRENFEEKYKPKAFGHGRGNSGIIGNEVKSIIMDEVTESIYKDLKAKVEVHEKHCEEMDIPCAVCGKRSVTTYKPMMGRAFYVCNEHRAMVSFVDSGGPWFEYKAKEIKLTHLDEQRELLEKLK